MTITLLSRIEAAANARLERYTLQQIRARIRHRRSVDAGVAFIFVRLPRTASTTVLHHLEADFGCLKLKRLAEIKAQKLEGPLTFGHVSIRMLRDEGLLPDAYYRKAFKFSFVRDPYTRAVSLYRYHQQVRILPKEMSFLTFLNMLKHDAIRPIGLYNSSSLSLCNPQHSWLDGIDLDFIGKVENLADDLAVVYRKLGREPVKDSLVHLRNTKEEDHMGLYSREETKLVNEIYRRDFEAFGYEQS